MFCIQLVSRAKVPVLKLKDNETSLEGDINVNSHRNIFHAYLFRCYVHLDSRVQPLGLVIKLWAKKAGIINQRDHKLSGKDNLTNSCLIIAHSSKLHDHPTDEIDITLQ